MKHPNEILTLALPDNMSYSSTIGEANEYILKAMEEYASLKVAEAKQLPTNNVTDEPNFLQEGKEEVEKICKKIALNHSHRNGFYDGHLEEDILNGFDEYISGWGMEYNQHYADFYHKKMLSLSSPEKQEAKQLHEVKDWDEVEEAFENSRKDGYVPHSREAFEFCKQNYLLPSEQTPDGWIFKGLFMTIRPSEYYDAQPVYFYPQQNKVSDAVEFAEWTFKNDWIPCNGSWRYGMIPQEWVYKTTTELYKIYSESKLK